MNADPEESRSSVPPGRTMNYLFDTRSVLRLLVPVALFLAGGWFIIIVWPVLLLLLIAVILALGLLPYVNDLVRIGIPRPLAIVALMLAILVVVGATIAYLVPTVVSEAQQIQENLPSYAGKSINS